jgi:hypothetical protein
LSLEVGLIVVAVTIAIMPHMVHGPAIAFLKAVAEFAAITFIHRRMLVHVMVVGIGVATIRVVAASSFDAFTEALTLWITVPIRGAIPIAIAVLIAILILGGTGCRLCFMRHGLDGSGRGDAKGKSGN